MGQDVAVDRGPQCTTAYTGILQVAQIGGRQASQSASHQRREPCMGCIVGMEAGVMHSAYIGISVQSRRPFQ